MKKAIFYLLFVMVSGMIMPTIVDAQEFPIGKGSLGGGAFDGTNYLIGIQGDLTNPNRVTAQLVSTGGSLTGARISLGVNGGEPQVAYDGTNYLMVWSSLTQDTVYGQFISAAGNLAGVRFVIATNASISQPKGGCIGFGDTSYLVVYKSNNEQYGRCISKAGVLLGTPVLITGNVAKESFMGFDGTNFLITWWRSGTTPADQDIFGQFISKSGALVGTNFMIDDGNYSSDNPISVTFDGSRYLVIFHEGNATGTGWTLYAHFVSPTGTVTPDRITIRESMYNPGLGFSAFDGKNYLVTWADNLFSSKSTIKGRFFNTSGVPVDTVFTVFSRIADKVPLFAAPIFKNNKFALVTTRVDTISFGNGDVYGKFIQSSTTGIKEIKNGYKTFTLYPNPATSTVTLTADNLTGMDVKVNIYSETGAWVKSYNLDPDNLRLSIADLYNGIYFLELRSRESVERQKLVIQR